MLLDIREKVRNSKPIKYTLITLICIPFALVGIGSYFSGGTGDPVAEVNGVEITPYELDNAYNQQRAQLSRMFGGNLPEGFANESILRQQALDQLISDQVLNSEVEKQKFAVGDDTLARAIRSVPAFQTNGQFDSEIYEGQVRSLGMTVQSFEASFRQDTALNQFRQGVIDSSFTLPSEQSAINALQNQSRTVDYLTYSLEGARETIEVSEADTLAYFDENADSYQFPQRAKLQYIELDANAIADAIEVTDEEAREFYESNRRSYMVPEGRDASHILLMLDDAGDEDEVASKTAAANDIRDRLLAGEDFAALAKELSDDVGSAENGGSLGAITPGAMVPEFEQAVFALASEGDVSEPVKTDFGVHVIKLDKIVAESGKPFEEVRDEVVENLKQRDADSEFFELREALAEAAFDSPESLDAASAATGLDIVTSDWVDIESELPSPLSNPQILTTAFSDDVLADGNNSELVTLSDRHVITLRVLDHEDPRPKTIDDVRDEIVDTLKTERAGALLDESVDGVLAALADGKAVVELADADELATATESEVLTRQSTVLDRAALTSIFGMAKPADGESTVGSAVTSAGDRLVVRLSAVGVADAEDGEAAADAETPTVDVANPRLGNSEFTALLQSLREQADVTLIE